jgi:anthranilate 1,2-dioxygenase small subunit
MKTDPSYTFRPSELEPARATALRHEIEAFNDEYCAVLDANLVEDWPRFFVADCVYRITARENAELGLPVGLVYAEGRGMLEDRAVAISRTQMFAPRYTLHMISNTRALRESADGEIAAEANFLLLQTLVEGATSIHMAGKFHDRFVRVDGRLLLKERQVVYDTTLIANDLVYPV